MHVPFCPYDCGTGSTSPPHFHAMTTTADDPSFQAHELVYCAKCFLPYDLQVNITTIDIPDDAPARSWFLTNCGHALCSKCLFPDSSISPTSPSLPAQFHSCRLMDCSAGLDRKRSKNSLSQMSARSYHRPPRRPSSTPNRYLAQSLEANGIWEGQLPPEILPYFRSVTEMSEEVIGAIKFQHHSLLHLVDHLRERIVHMTRTVQQTRDAAEKEKAYLPLSARGVVL